MCDITLQCIHRLSYKCLYSAGSPEVSILVKIIIIWSLLGVYQQLINEDSTISSPTDEAILTINQSKFVPVLSRSQDNTLTHLLLPLYNTCVLEMRSSQITEVKTTLLKQSGHFVLWQNVDGIMGGFLSFPSRGSDKVNLDGKLL